MNSVFIETSNGDDQVERRGEVEDGARTSGGRNTAMYCIKYNFIGKFYKKTIHVEPGFPGFLHVTALPNKGFK